MPQSSRKLQRRFRRGQDRQAWDYLKCRGFTEERFLIKLPNGKTKLTRGELKAIQYLMEEWDWGCTGVKYIYREEK